MKTCSLTQGKVGKAAAYILLFSVIATIIDTGAYLSLSRSQEIHAIEDRVVRTGDSYIGNIVSSIRVNDTQQVQQQLVGMHQLPDMQYLELRLNNGAQLTEGKTPTGDTLTRQFPLVYASGQDTTDYGILRVVTSVEQVHSNLLDAVPATLVTHGTRIFLVAGAVFFIFYYFTTQHIEAISTSRKEAEATLKKTSDQLQNEQGRRVEAERLACVGEISASIAHEIRNPLYSIINSAALLENNKISPREKSEVANIINSESRRLQRILDDFLDFARQRPPELVKDNIIEVLQEVIDSVLRSSSHAGLIQRSIEFHTDVCYALYDPDHMRQVSWNLLQNAVQAMPDGGVLTVRTSQTDDAVCVTIANTGASFPGLILPQITRPFVSGRPNGTGLGLAIVQRILTQHQSDLSIRNLDNDGAEVSFRLKRA
jgi:signal transduction histidine kinase